MRRTVAVNSLRTRRPQKDGVHGDICGHGIHRRGGGRNRAFGSRGGHQGGSDGPWRRTEPGRKPQRSRPCRDLGHDRLPDAHKETLSDDALTAALITPAPPGSKWRDIELESGAVVLYGQGAHHTTVNPGGISFVFASVDAYAVRAAADSLGAAMRWPASGGVEMLPKSHTPALGLALRSLSAPQPRLTRAASASDLVPSLVDALDECRIPGERRACRRIDNAEIVAACVAYAEVVQRVPTRCIRQRVAEMTSTATSGSCSTSISTGPRCTTSPRSIRASSRR